MRLLHRDIPGNFLIMPVSVNVGRGTVLVSLQSTGSVPPYRLQNLCSSLQVMFCQEGLPTSSNEDASSVPSRRGGLDPTSSSSARPSRAEVLAPSSSVDYAFDEPMGSHKLLLSAPGPDGEEVSVTVDLDNLGGQQVWVLPSTSIDFSQLQVSRWSSSSEQVEKESYTYYNN